MIRNLCSSTIRKTLIFFIPGHNITITSFPLIISKQVTLPMATLSSVNLVTLRTIANGPDVPTLKVPCLNRPWKRVSPMKLRVGPVRAAPDGISEKVEKSIKEAQEMCSDDPASGECVAAWDEVEELSAAASHARDKKKDDDPLENYCKDNPETDECRTYDN